MYSAHLLINENTTWHTFDMSEPFRMEEILFPINLGIMKLPYVHSFRNDDDNDDDDDEEDDEDEDEE